VPDARHSLDACLATAAAGIFDFNGTLSLDQDVLASLYREGAREAFGGWRADRGSVRGWRIGVPRPAVPALDQALHKGCEDRDADQHQADRRRVLLHEQHHVDRLLTQPETAGGNLPAANDVHAPPVWGPDAPDA